MSWDIFLIRTNTNQESDVPDVSIDVVIPFDKTMALNTLKSVGKIGGNDDRPEIWLDDRTCVEISFSSNCATIHFSIGGNRDVVCPWLANIQSQLGGRYYDVSNQYFLELQSY